MIHTAATSLLLCVAAVCRLTGAVIQNVNNFTSFPNRFVADIGNASQFPLPLGGDNIVGPFTVGGVTITSGNAPLINGLYFASASTGGGREVNSPDIPGNAASAVVSGNATFFQMHLPDLVVNFSQPIFGFGTTFLHDVSGMPQQLDASGPAMVSVFTGLNGTGTLLGSVADRGGVNVLDFIGLLSDTADIQSAILSSSGPFGAFQADAFGLSVGPAAPPASAAPEPGSFGLVLLGLLGYGLARRTAGH